MMMNMGGSGSMSGSGGMGMMDMDMMNMGMSSGQSGMQMGAMASGGMQGMQGMQGMPYPGQMMGGYGYPGAADMHGSVHGGATNVLGSADLNSLLIGLFNLAINIFSILLIVALIVAAVVYLKRFLTTGTTPLFGANTNGSCSCGQVLQAQWNCCPKCGQAKNVVVKSSEPQTV